MGRREHANHHHGENDCLGDCSRPHDLSSLGLCEPRPRHCFSSLVIVFAPPMSVAVKITLSSGCKALNISPSCTLNSSEAPPELAPTVPPWVCRIAIRPLASSTLLTVPMRLC